MHAMLTFHQVSFEKQHRTTRHDVLYFPYRSAFLHGIKFAKCCAMLAFNHFFFKIVLDFTERVTYTVFGYCQMWAYRLLACDVVQLADQSVHKGNGGKDVMSYGFIPLFQNLIEDFLLCHNQEPGNFSYLNNVPFSKTPLGGDPLLVPIQFDHFWGVNTPHKCQPCSL